ncbi:hypothetical protein KPK_3386 [Klebsiella variicola]|uniref:Uncharacterized protein n=1 Tax=Klebsiella variicola (strain 342) TaxID=507522 RepID=B5XSK9_KLEV3|nr:hypothetical protein KPK_3386 [Klebsiella variicola]
MVINTFDKKRCYHWRSRFRSWHRADNLNGMKVCFERTADLYTHDHRLCMHYEHSAVVIIGSCST